MNNLVFETTTHTSKQIQLPPRTPMSDALSIFHNHDTVLRLDPDLTSYTALPSSPDLSNTKNYSVIDRVEALPKGLWSSSATSRQELTDKDDGIAIIIRAPLGVVVKAVWTIKAEGEGLVLNFVSDITASRFLAGFLTKRLEQNWNEVSEAYLKRLTAVQLDPKSD